VSGRVVGVKAMEKEVTELIVRSHDSTERVEFAVVAVQHVEGVTIRFEWWRRLLREAMSRWLPNIRNIPLAIEAILIVDGERVVLGWDESNCFAWMNM
ncbi:hypothetical protein GY45DRAFT_1259283, partial [Cubamyces sp. BRFM 1775]